jgi:hypothetical protein
LLEKFHASGGTVLLVPTSAPLCRANYAVVLIGSTAVVLIRNPLGAISLGVLTFGALLYLDVFAKRTSSTVMQLIHKVDPQRAVQIRSRPGGHDGTRCGVGGGIYALCPALTPHMCAIWLTV